MKKLLRFLLIFAVVSAIGIVCFADPSPSPSPVVVAATQPFFQTVYAWIMGHQIILGGLMASILDFIFALNPKWKSNGLAHWLYLFARKKADLPVLPVA